MKKILAAGSAVALAALPMAGVFAADDTSVTDNLSLTVNASCTFDTEDGEYTVTNPMLTNDFANFAGTTNRSDNQTELVVYCNSVHGYEVTATFTGLTGYVDNTQGAQTNGDSINYNGSAAPEAGSGTWAAYKASGYIGDTAITAGLVSASGAKVMESATVTGGSATHDENFDNLVITYSVGTGSQKAGYYKGTAVYALSTKNS